MLIGAGFASGFDYPASINDTTAHTNPFFLQIWSTQNTAYAFRAVGIESDGDSNWRPVIKNNNVVAAFQLVDGYLELASPENLHGAADGLRAAFGPEMTSGDFVSKSFFFTNSSDAAHNNWELLNLSDDGLFSILSHEPAPSTWNDGSGYYLKYEGSPDGSVSAGCDAVALRTFLGPPFENQN
ncbi:hypothetical protein JX266_013783 [Neoarthrinium moseri]|nr:hypothetical protein JX266_013783 [Neoarthrinium moseri]